MSTPMPPVLDRECDPRNIVRAIEFCTANDAGHHVPLLLAVSQGRIAYSAVTDRLSRPNMHRLNRHRAPGLILVGDDDDSPTGPLGWVAAGQLIRWARVALVHGSGAEVRSYVTAVMLAETSGRALLVETSSDAVQPWLEALHNAEVPTLVVIPPGDGVHPVENAA